MLVFNPLTGQFNKSTDGRQLTFGFLNPEFYPGGSDSDKLTAADTDAVERGLPLLIAKAWTIQDITLNADLFFRGGTLAASSAVSGNIVLNGRILAERTQIFSGSNLVMPHPSDGLEGGIFVPDNLYDYPIRNKATSIVFPEWWGAQPTNVIDWDNPTPDSTNAFYSMARFICSGDSKLDYVVLGPGRSVHFWTKYNRWVTGARSLTIQQLSFGNSADYIYTQDFGFRFGGASWFATSSSSVTYTNYAAYKITSLSGGDILKESQIVKLVNAASASDYTEGGWVYLCSWIQQTAGYPPNFRYLSYHRVKAVTGDEITLESPIPHNHYLTAPVYQYGDSLMGEPALLPNLGQVMEKLVVKDCSIIPPTKLRAGTDSENRFSINNVLEFIFEDVNFLARPVDPGYTYGSVSGFQSGLMRNVTSDYGHGVWIEVDKNAENLKIENVDVDLGGATGLQNLQLKDSSMIGGGAPYGLDSCKYENVKGLQSKSQFSRLTYTPYFKTDRPFYASYVARYLDAGSEARFISDTELEITSSRLQDVVTRLFPGSRFYTVKSSTQTNPFNGVWGRVVKLQSFTYDSQVGDQFVAIYEVKLYTYPEVGQSFSSPIQENEFYRIHFPRFDYAEIDDASSQHSGITRFDRYNMLTSNNDYLIGGEFCRSTSRIGTFWNNYRIQFQLEVPLPEINSIAPVVISPVGPVLIKRTIIRMIKPYAGTFLDKLGNPFTRLRLRIGNQSLGFGYRNQTRDDYIDLTDMTTRVLAVDKLITAPNDDFRIWRDYWNGLAIRLDTNSPASGDNRYPEDWDTQRPILEFLFEVDSVLLEETAPKPALTLNLQGTSAPLSGYYQVGDKVSNTNPTPGSYLGWVCTGTGSPGTWKGYGLIQS